MVVTPPDQRCRSRLAKSASTRRRRCSTLGSDVTGPCDSAARLSPPECFPIDGPAQRREGPAFSTVAASSPRAVYPFLPRIIGLLSGLRRLQLRPAQRLAELVLLLRSRGLLPLRNPVQYGLADGSS